MFGKTAIWLRGIAVALALVIGLSAAPQAFAAQGTTEPPEGLTGGASLEYTDEASFSTLLFNVFSFEDEETATSGLDALVDAATAPIDALADDSENGTPAAAPEAIELTDVEGLDALGDDARAYETPIGDGVTLINLFVRDGTNVHYWASVVADLGSLDGSASTPEATPATESGIDLLLGIATPWFEDGINRDGELIDQLPGADAVPDGYVESNREESLDIGA